MLEYYDKLPLQQLVDLRDRGQIDPELKNEVGSLIMKKRYDAKKAEKKLEQEKEIARLKAIEAATIGLKQTDVDNMIINDESVFQFANTTTVPTARSAEYGNLPQKFSNQRFPTRDYANPLQTVKEEAQQAMIKNARMPTGPRQPLTNSEYNQYKATNDSYIVNSTRNIFQKDDPRDIMQRKTEPMDVNPPLRSDNLKYDELRRLLMG